jgi:hypothetical protein
LKTNTHFFIDEAYKRTVCTTLRKPTTGTMTTLLKEEPLSIEKEREKNERDYTASAMIRPRISVKHPIYRIMRARIPREKEKTHEWLKLESKCMRE